jgi:hypothetical protein
MPNKTIKELHEAIKTGRTIDPLKGFSEAVREEAHLQYPRGYWLFP